MSKFSYTAMDGNGKEQKGRIEAGSEDDAGQKLKERGLFPTSILESKGSNVRGTRQALGHAKPRLGGVFGQPRMRPKTLTMFTRRLATLLDAGLPLVRALRTLEKQAKRDPVVRRIVADLAATVEGGSTFSDALREHRKSFSKLYVSMVRAGEVSGAMELVLERVADFMEKGQQISAKVKGALVYPAIVLTVAGGITGGLMVFIVPRFSKIFTEMLPNESLPPLTRAVIGTSTLMKEQMPLLLCVLALAVAALKLLKASRAGSYVIDAILIKAPLVNQLVVRSVMSRTCRTLGTLMQSGVDVLHSLQIVRDTAGNEVVAQAIGTVQDAVKEGEGMAGPMEATSVFPAMVVGMVEVGEETGALPEMLNRIADVYEGELDNAVAALTSMIEPIMMVLMAVIVGSIVIALFLPLIKLITIL